MENFFNNCISEDEERVNEIFENKLESMCTWNTGMWITLMDEFDNGRSDELPENIDYSKMRLKANKTN